MKRFKILIQLLNIEFANIFYNALANHIFVLYELNSESIIKSFHTRRLRKIGFKYIHFLFKVDILLYYNIDLQKKILITTVDRCPLKVLFIFS